MVKVKCEREICTMKIKIKTIYHGKSEIGYKMDTMRRRKIALVMVLGNDLADCNVNQQEQNKSQIEKSARKIK